MNFTMDADLPRERAPRFYCPDPLSPGAVVALPDQAVHHIMRVLRMAPEQRVRLFDGRGGEWSGTIRSISKAGVSVHVTAHTAREVEASLKIVLAQGISSRERMDLTVQ
jgi:16S rRNA (uracil1498-N3)-methyltransferase